MVHTPLQSCCTTSALAQIPVWARTIQEYSSANAPFANEAIPEVVRFRCTSCQSGVAGVITMLQDERTASHLLPQTFHSLPKSSFKRLQNNKKLWCGMESTDHNLWFSYLDHQKIEELPCQVEHHRHDEEPKDASRRSSGVESTAQAL